MHVFSFSFRKTKKIHSRSYGESQVIKTYVWVYTKREKITWWLHFWLIEGKGLHKPSRIGETNEIIIGQLIKCMYSNKDGVRKYLSLTFHHTEVPYFLNISVHVTYFLAVFMNKIIKKCGTRNIQISIILCVVWLCSDKVGNVE